MGLRDRLAARVERSERYPWIVLTAALVGLFSVGFSITVLSIAIPRIAAEFDTTRNVMIWVITGPILLGAILTPSAGKIADLFGARRVYLTSMLVVAACAGLASVSWSAGSLIAFRILGGAVGAATGPASIAIINRLFPAGKRAQALGYWSLVAAGGPVIGALVGGPVVEFVNWRWIFVAQVPLSLVTVAVCAVVFPHTPRDRSTRFDVIGAVLLALGSAGFVIALNRAPEVGWTHPLVLIGFVSAPVLLTAFVLYERGIENQLIPLRYFKRRNFSFAMINQFFANFTYMGGFFLTPFLLGSVLDYTPSKIVVVSIVRPLAFAIMGPLAGWAATKIGERINALAGGTFLLLSMLVFSTVAQGSGELVVLVALMFSGVGMGMTAPAMAAAVANAVDDKDLGVAGGTQQMISQLGVVVGTQVFITVQTTTATTGATDASSYAKGYLVGGVATVSAIIAAGFIRSSVGRTDAEVAAEPLDAPQALVYAEAL